MLREYQRLTTATTRKSAVMDYVSELMTRGTASARGDTYQSLRSRVARDARGTQDPEFKMALNGIREAIDDVMDRSIAKSTPHLAGDYRKVRNQYRNLLQIEDAVAGTTEAANQGLITPTRLGMATQRNQGKRGYTRGRGDLTELSRAGNALLKPLANSNTAARLAARGLMGVGAGLEPTATSPTSWRQAWVARSCLRSSPRLHSPGLVAPCSATRLQSR